MDNNVSFDMIANGWNAIRANGAPNLRKIVSGFIDPRRILLQRADETPESITLVFRGFDQALDNPERDGPILKRAILAWLKAFTEAQIDRSGDPSTFVVRIIKSMMAPAAPAPTPIQTIESINSKEELAHITRKING